MTTVAIVGMGYVGLPTALSLADHGDHIIGYDVSEERLADIKSGRVDLLKRDHARLATHLSADMLRLTTEPAALAEAEAVIVCVPTPIDVHQSPDLRALKAACADVVDNAVAGQAIVLTSTTYVGCTRELVAHPLADRGFTVGSDIFVAFAPERIDPGVTAHAQDTTPRVVGGVTHACTARATRILQSTASMMHLVTSPEVAEMTKLLENSFRAVNIAFINEFAEAARELDVDVMEVIGAAATKPYGFTPFYPGPGVGGHCIPCDSHYLLWQLRARRMDAPVMRTAMTAIALRPREIVAQARTLLAESGCATHGARVLVIGVAYKPNVADVRESPALEIIDELVHAGADVSYHDPWVESIGQFYSIPRPELSQWDLVIIHTRHADADLSWLNGHYAVLDTTYQKAHS